MFQTVLGTCRPIHVIQFSRNAVITGHSTINVDQHLHAEIDISNASDIHYAHPLNTACIQIRLSVAYNARWMNAEIATCAIAGRAVN